MKHLVLFAAICGLSFAAPAQAQDLKTELQTFANDWAATYNRGDAAALSASYASEVVLVNPKDGSKTTVTRQQLAAEDAETFSTTTNQIAVTIGTAEAQADGKVRITGSVSITVTNKASGEKASYAGTFDHLTLKVNGQWQLCQMQISFN